MEWRETQACAPLPARIADGGMFAMVLDTPGSPLRQARLPLPCRGENDLLIRVHACGVCRTDLHIVDGELSPHKSPLILGHQIVGTVVEAPRAGSAFRVGDRVGVPWLAGACGHCQFCASRHENLCDEARFTGYDRDGGYAQFAAAQESACFLLPDRYDDVHAAPLLCAGLIGYRAYSMLPDAQTIGLYGFGAAAHIIAQFAVQQGKRVYAFTRPGDGKSQAFAMSLGAAWAGHAGQAPPSPLDGAIIFAPDGALIPQALGATRKGGTVVCAGIHMTDLPSFPYSLLWGERQLRSVANLTRADGEYFFAALETIDIRTVPSVFPLAQANAALQALRSGAVEGAVVLTPLC